MEVVEEIARPQHFKVYKIRWFILSLFVLYSTCNSFQSVYIAAANTLKIEETSNGNWGYPVSEGELSESEV